jgi:hypothetical protein
VSISPTFYALLFCTKVLREVFWYIHYKFELLLAQNYWRKCAQKMLVKLTTLLPTLMEQQRDNSSFEIEKYFAKKSEIILILTF